MVLAVLVLAACGSEQATVVQGEPGDIVVVGDPSTTGLPLQPGQAGTYGSSMLWNGSGDTVTILDVQPLGVDGLEVIDLAGYLPPGSASAPGAGHGWPPQDLAGELFDLDGKEWPSGDVPLQIVAGVRLAPEATQGRLDGFSVEFEQNGRRFRVETPHALEVTTN